MSRADVVARLLSELYDRQRQAPTSQNKSLTKSLFPVDTVAIEDVATLTLRTPPFKYAPTAGTKLVYGQGQWE